MYFPSRTCQNSSFYSLTELDVNQFKNKSHQISLRQIIEKTLTVKFAGEIFGTGRCNVFPKIIHTYESIFITKSKPPIMNYFRSIQYERLLLNIESNTLSSKIALNSRCQSYNLFLCVLHFE